MPESVPEAVPDDLAGHVVLVGDVGGTYARFALARDARLLSAPERVERARWPDLLSACRHYLHGQGGGPRIEGAAIAAAGRVQDGRIAMTNADWSIDPPGLAAGLGLRAERVLALNDFAALARVLPSLGTDEIGPVRGGARARSGAPPPPGSPHGNRVVLGPGTGLGVAATVRTAHGWQALASEGGHASCAPETPLERAAHALAARRFGRVSWERLLSGPGLALLHEAACLEAGAPLPQGGPAAVVQGCARGEPLATLAARTFIELLGAFAGDLALIYDAAGGVVVAGGVMPRLAEVMPLEGLRTRFEAKGRFADWLATVPLGLLSAPDAALRGAAIAYRG